MNNPFNEYLENYKDSQTEIHIEEYDVIRLTKKSRFTTKIVENLMNNIVIPFPNFDSFELKEIKDWDMTSEKYGDSYQLYIHSLRSVNELLITYEESNEIKYLDKAKEYIENWIEFARYNKGSNMVWYDHPAAQRIQVIVFYLFLSKGHHNVDEAMYRSILKYHSRFLSDSTNYRRNNHGLMMDRSLMILGNILEDESIFNIGYYRSIDTFWHSYSYTGMHLENSPEYHNMVTNMYIELQKYLSIRGKSYGATIVSFLNRASILKNTFTKPNKIIPSIGDSGNGVAKINKRYENFVDYAAGLSIIQDEKNEYFLTFISGYSTITHKHIDDLSFNLFYKGRDFFVDPGKYSYSKHPYRSYVKSFKGHSGIFINNKNYKITDKNRLQKSVYIDHHFENHNYMLIKGCNKSYIEGELSRTIIFLKEPQVTVFIDEVKALEDITVLHNFNLHHKVELIKLNEFSYRLVHGDASLVLSNHDEVTFKRVNGDKYNEPYKAINSVVFNEVVETTQLKSIEKLKSNVKSFKVYSIYDDSLSPDLELDNGNRVICVNVSNKKYYINF